MIRFKSISEQRLDFAFEKVQEVISLRNSEGVRVEWWSLDCLPDGDLVNYIPSKRKEGANNKQYSEFQKTYHQYVKSTAMLILNSGLVSALLFMHGKSRKAESNDAKALTYKVITTHLTEWLSKQGHTNGQTGKDAIRYLYDQNSHHIRRATLESVKFLEDLKRVSDARLYKDKN